MSERDLAVMRVALGLAARGLGLVAPNPAVGCVLVRGERIVGRGWTQAGGRPHAETEALTRAGAAARGATAYVTLEPCAHHGRTPPCADALIAAGIARAVVALVDPDPRVAGAGIARLQAAGIETLVGPLGDEAARLNCGFLFRVERGRPLVTLKLASSLDGRIATSTGESRWITGTESRRLGHLLRRRHDAVMVGAGTALADDPELTVRLAGLDRDPPLRIVVDGGLRMPPGARLVASATQVPTLIATTAPLDAARAAPFEAAGVELLALPPDARGHVDLPALLQALGARGLTRILVEGGAGLAAALVAAGLVDRLAWFRSPDLIGGDGLAALGPLGLATLAERVRGVRNARQRSGDDIVEWVDLPLS